MSAKSEKKGSSRRKRRPQLSGFSSGGAPAASSGPVRGRGHKGEERRPPPPKSPFEMMQAAFFACPRCSYFLASYRARHGLESLQAAAVADDSSWLDLKWNPEMPALLQNSLGGEADAALFHYSISCPECHRVFLYHQEEGGEATFQVEVQPRKHR